MELYKKYRPKSFKDLHGQNTQSLEKLIKKNQTPQAILLSGPSGCGKTTIGRILKNKLKCSKYNFTEMNAAEETGIDCVRRVQSNVLRAGSINGGVRIWLIDECHKLTNSAQSALLKMLEDTPEDVYFILATTDPQKVLATIKTRCTHLVVKSLQTKDLTNLLSDVCDKEDIKIKESVLEKIIEYSDGSARKALVYLNGVMPLDSEKEMLNSIISEETETKGIDIARALLKNTNWKTMASILKEAKKEEPETIRRIVLGYSSTVLLGGPNKMSSKAFIILDSFQETFFYTGFAGLVHACYEILMGE